MVRGNRSGRVAIHWANLVAHGPDNRIQSLKRDHHHREMVSLPVRSNGELATAGLKVSMRYKERIISTHAVCIRCCNHCIDWRRASNALPERPLLLLLGEETASCWKDGAS